MNYSNAQRRRGRAVPTPETQGRRRLVAAWRTVKLGDLAETCSGTTPSRGRSDYYGGKIPWVKTGELVDAEIYDTEEHVTEQAVRETSLRLLPKETLLVAMYGQGQTRGRTGLLKTEATTNQACFAILPGDRFEPAFLQLWFCHSYQRLRDQTEGRGGNQPNLNGNVLRQETVPLPPLKEQRRIVAELREQMAEVERARAAVQAQLDAAQSLPAALLRAIFTSPAAQRWPRQPFGELVVNHDGRRVPLKHSDRANRQGLYPYYGASGIIDRIDDYLFEGEFLLIGEDGANLLARSTPIAFRASGKFWVNNHAHVVQPKPGIRIELLEHYFAALDLSRYITGSAQPKLSQGILNEIPFPVPPLAEQQKIATRLDTELTAARSLVETLETRLAEIELLPATLLRTAFRGGDGLVPS